MDRFLFVSEARSDHAYVVPADDFLNVYVLDIRNEPSDFNVHLTLGARANAAITISAFGNRSSAKNYHVDILHNDNDGVSKCSFYGVATDKAKLEVIIQTEIRKGTTNTNSAQRIKGIMLSNEATIHGEPKLLIDDNNVKAAHSLGVGQLNPEHLFYLQSRGLSRASAVRLLISGYFNEVLSFVADEKLREKYGAEIARMVL